MSVFILVVILAAAVWWLNRWVHLQTVAVNDKAVLITGCDSGFGNMLAQRLDRIGMRVFAGCLTPNGAKELRATLSAHATVLMLDVTDEKSIDAAYADIAQNHSQNLWALVNNAGVADSQIVHLTPLSGWRRSFDINFFGAVAITKRFLPLLIGSRGRIINMSSMLGFVTPPGSGPYAASKHALESFSDATRRELAPFGVQVSVIEPGFHRSTLVTDGASSLRRYYEMAPPALQNLYGAEWIKASVERYDKVSTRAAPASNVVDVYVSAITAQVPHTRYVVGIDSQIMNVLSRVLPSRVLDYIFSIRAPVPGSVSPKGRHPTRDQLAAAAVTAVVDRHSRHHSHHHSTPTKPATAAAGAAAVAGMDVKSPPKKAGAASPAPATTTAAGVASPTGGPGASTKKRYETVRVLGAGASCKVLLARHRESGKLYARKVLNKTAKNNRFYYENETKILRTLKHPNILELVENREGKTAFYLTTVAYSGGELFDRISAHGRPFTERSAARLAKQMIEALHACHRARITHRDVKPENFVFDAPPPAASASGDDKKSGDDDDVGRLRLIDFGCALELADTAVFKDAAGSPYYIAPEVLDASAEASNSRTGAVWRASDMWSIGVILFLLVCGYPPFYADTDTDIFKLIKKGVFVFPTTKVGDPLLSSAVRDLIVKLLVKEPTKRLTSEQALAHPWIAEKNAASDQVLNVVGSLSAFRARCRLQRAVGRVMASRLSVSDAAQLDAVFTRYDVNNDGTLSKDEITQMMSALGKTAADIKSFCSSVDEDGDGTISRHEFAIAMSTARLGSSDADLRAAFNLFDKDGDGSVSVSEIKAMCGDFISAEECERLVRDVDVNGDGQISLSEWIAAMKDIKVKASGSSDVRPSTATARTDTLKLNAKSSI